MMTEYQERCQLLLESLDNIKNKELLGLNYDPRPILKISNRIYEDKRFFEKELDSFSFADKFFNFPKEDELDEEENTDNLDRIANNLIESYKVNSFKRGFQTDEEIKKIDDGRPIFNEKVKKRIIRNIQNTYKKPKIHYEDYDAMYLDRDLMEKEDNEEDFENLKKFKMETLFGVEFDSKNNIMDICDMIGKEIQKEDNQNVNKFSTESKGVDSPNRNTKENFNSNCGIKNTLVYEEYENKIEDTQPDIEMKKSDGHQFKKIKKRNNRINHEI